MIERSASASGVTVASGRAMIRRMSANPIAPMIAKERKRATSSGTVAAVSFSEGTGNSGAGPG